MKEWVTISKAFFLRALRYSKKKKSRKEKKKPVRQTESEKVSLNTYDHLCNSIEDDDEVVWWSTTQLLLQRMLLCDWKKKRSARARESFFFFSLLEFFFSSSFLHLFRAYVTICTTIKNTGQRKIHTYCTSFFTVNDFIFIYIYCTSININNEQRNSKKKDPHET